MIDSSVSITRTIQADVSRVWNSVSEIGGIENWSTPIGDSEVSGEGVGAKRICNFADGSGKVFETIETIDSENRIFQYSVQDVPMPIANALGTISLRDLGDEGTEVTWSLKFQVAAEMEEDMKQTIVGFYEDGIQGLERVNQPTENLLT